MSAKFFESLESRQLMSVSYNAFTDTLTITGTAATAIPNRLNGGTAFIGGVDDLRVELQDEQTLRISDNGSVTFRELDTVRRIVMDGQSGSDTLFVGADVNLPATLTGGAGNDTLTGGAAADSINGGEGNDQLNGGAGNDTFDGGTGADIFNGGAGTDLVTYATRTASVFANLDGLANDGEAGEGDRIASNVEQLTGGSGADRLTGSNGGNLLVGNGGNDVLSGRGGADLLQAGDGDDLILASSGNDTAMGQAGHDVINGAAGGDVLSGGLGNDVIIAGAGRDMVNGDEGDDVIFAGEDQIAPTPNLPNLNDVINGGTGNDVVESDALDTRISAELVELV
jgi:Ca2+-binding RTX toxin-like protein